MPTRRPTSSSPAPEAAHTPTQARQTDRTHTLQIQGQAALVTGGASGLGEATARELARLGAKVAVLDRNAELAA